MTPQQFRKIEEVYFLVKDLPRAERDAAIAAATRDDPAVAAEVRSLIGEALPASFMATPVLGAGVVSVVAPHTPDTLLGRMVGPWRIDRLLGAGGMGAVYLATRADGAFEGLAAIKIVKRGMDTDELLHRFHDERRTLANLNHPNIAKLLDAGSLADGRPYLVMEYVAGLPITQYCRDRGLTTDRRLRLFILVCQAVQFAHQNLVVHRDLKPGNILVTESGDPKLLDFGISKVLTESGTATAATTLEERRLTPEYASPEQVEGQPVTTASDIYSLGVILYELLAGKQPYQFEPRTTAEIHRVVSSVTPPPPSAAVVGGPPAERLRHELRGDLDTIVAAAMRKEAHRRYPSAERLGADVDAYLRGFPVSAQPDRLGYRLGKFVRRHAWAVSAAAAGAGLLIGGLILISWQSRIARSQRDQAFLARDQAEAIAKFHQDVLASVQPERGGMSVTVTELLDRTIGELNAGLTDQPLVQAGIRSAVGASYLAMGEYDKAETQIRAAYEQRLSIVGPHHHDTAESMIDLASVLYAKRQFPEAERFLRQALDVFRGIRGEHNIDVARTLNNLGAVLRSQQKLDEAADSLRQAIEIRRATPEVSALDLAESMNNYAGVLRDQARLREAEAMLTEALAIRRRLLRPDNALVAQSVSNLAVIIAVEGDLPRAEPLFEEAIKLEREALGPDHPDRAMTLSSLATVKRSKGDAAGAEPLLREAVRIRDKALPPTDARALQARLMLAEVLVQLDHPDEALGLADAMAQSLNSPGVEREARTRLAPRLAGVYDALHLESAAQQVRKQAAQTSPAR